MFNKFLLIFILIFSLNSCSKDELGFDPKNNIDPYKLYQEGFVAFEKGDYFFSKNFQKQN